MSDNIAIRVENVSKQYRLGQVGTGTLSNDLKRWWSITRGKGDPFLKIGVENDRTKKQVSDFAWALQDVSFDVKQGDTLGIIGKNGAGKSTLLKLLSRVTTPTTGQIKIKGRIASLLEVGTGFNPELTGRENIYMNGAILGMTKSEIKSKFDEIVDFSGVEMYIDTPVKRYSSGMYVRLAFGVAAHLEPEILIVDEVLAVGDAEFQKKCLGKMGDVASHGRTVLFVSHNMQAVQSLCAKSLYMKAGRVVEIGPTDTVINNYLSKEVKNRSEIQWTENEAPGDDNIKLLGAKVIAIDGNPNLTIESEMLVQFDFVLYKNYNVNLSIHLNSVTGLCIFNAISQSVPMGNGTHRGELRIPGNLLNDDSYVINLYIVKDLSVILFSAEDLLSFEISDVNRSLNWFGKWKGVIRPELEFNLM